MPTDLHHIRAGVLDVAFLDQGPRDGAPVVLLHGFPYDVHAFGEVAPALVAAGCRVVTPYLRGYGPTRFVSPHTPRSGEQAVLAHDALALMDALGIGRAVLAGYDWGGRAACIAAALWPQRVAGLVTCGGYNVHDVPGAMTPAQPEDEHRLWYQYYFHGERGRAGLALHRRALARLLWQAVVAALALRRRHLRAQRRSLRQPGLRRRRHPLLPRALRPRGGRPRGGRHRAAAARQARRCRAHRVPAWRGRRRVRPEVSAGHRRFFTGPYARRVIDRIGHNVPQEAPVEFAQAVLELVRGEVQGQVVGDLPGAAG
jgi:pimeloyl-ACP methyl ester carboxylesterase